MTLAFDYHELRLRFCQIASTLPDFRLNYSCLFHTIMTVAEEETTDILNEPYPFWHSLTHIGKRDYYDALRWLTDAGFIVYETGSGKKETKILLKVNRSFKVSYGTLPETLTEKYHTPDLASTRTHEQAHADQGSRGCAPLDVVTDLVDYKDSNAVTITGESAAAPYSPPTHLHPYGSEGGGGRQFVPKEPPTLLDLVDEFQTLYPNKYPSALYTNFVSYMLKPADKAPDVSRWVYFSTGYLDKLYFLKIKLEENWGIKSHLYPNWQDGKGEVKKDLFLCQ